MTSINSTGPVQGPDSAAQPNQTGQLARSFQDLLLAQNGRGGPTTVTITLAHGEGGGFRGAAEPMRPVVITAVHGQDNPLQASGGAVVITAVHGNGHPSQHPDERPQFQTITAVLGGNLPHHDPAVSVITFVNGGTNLTPLPNAASLGLVTITAVNRSE